MTKRVALARALALDPAIVFLDEPTSGLDPIAAGDFDALIKTLQKALGLTVFMVTHDLASLNTVCDRVAALADGKIVAIGPMRRTASIRIRGCGPISRASVPRCCNPKRARQWKPALPSSLSAPSCWRRSPPYLASSTGCTMPVVSVRARDLPRPVRRLGARAVGWRCGAVQRHPRRRSLRARSRAG